MLTRFIFASDLHGDQQDKKAVKALHTATGYFKPHLRIFGGDLIDARPLRRGANAEERSESMLTDWRKGLEFISTWKPTHLLMGNHDQRLWDLAEADKGIETDYAWKGIQELEARLEKEGTKWLPYHKRKGVFEFGKLKCLHGFFAGVNSARQMALTYGNCLFGHTHSIDEHAIPGLNRRVARGAGCLCKLDMKYNERTPGSLRHAHGFIMGVINEKTGNYWSIQCEEIDGKWVIPETIKTI
tara:strand:- start:269 stop:994 length:726 start_codon:yes stop_codon:yes gene_type:complete